MPARKRKVPFFVGGHPDPFEIGNSGWDRLEKAYKQSLPITVRREIASVTKEYLVGSMMEKEGALIDGAKKTLRDIRSAAECLGAAVPTTTATLDGIHARNLLFNSTPDKRVVE